MSTIVNEVPLKVYEAYTRDVGRGIARINYDIMDTLNVKTGGVIEIMGNRTNIYKSRSVAKFFPLYAHDEGQGIIRLDALLADNAGTAISGIENKETVMVRRISTVPAERVVVLNMSYLPERIDSSDLF